MKTGKFFMKVIKTEEGYRVEDENGVFIILLEEDVYNTLKNVNTKLMQDRFNKYITKYQTDL